MIRRVLSTRCCVFRFSSAFSSSTHGPKKEEKSKEKLDQEVKEQFNRFRDAVKEKEEKEEKEELGEEVKEQFNRFRDAIGVHAVERAVKSHVVMRIVEHEESFIARVVLRRAVRGVALVVPLAGAAMAVFLCRADYKRQKELDNMYAIRAYQFAFGFDALDLVHNSIGIWNFFIDHQHHIDFMHGEMTSIAIAVLSTVSAVAGELMGKKPSKYHESEDHHKKD